jgi:GNAT superfamily N-acetyltransferase
VEVRRAVPQDARGIAEVHVRSWQDGYRGLLPDDLLDGLSVELRERTWDEILGGSSGVAGFTLVAVEAQVIGFCSAATPSRDADAAPRTAEITALYVDPSRWRSGIGHLLLKAMFDALRRDRWKRVELWVFADNARARASYETVGFHPDGAEKRDDGGPVQVRLVEDLARS